MKTLTLAIAVALLASACGAPASTDDTAGDTTTTAAASSGDAITFMLDGGCMMMGPNCPTYVLARDGSFELYRTGDSQVVATGTLGAGPAADMWDAVDTTDFDDLVSALGPGECRGCVDGIDTKIVVTVGGVEHTLDSTQVGFDPGIELFAQADKTIAALSGAAPLETIAR